MEVLRVFRAEYSHQLSTVALARAADVEGMFKSFGVRIRVAINGATRPLLQHLERVVGVRSALLVRKNTTVFAADHPRDAELVADLQGLVDIADDVLSLPSTRGRGATVELLLGANVRIERLATAALVVVTEPPTTWRDVGKEIERVTFVLQRCKCLTAAFLKSVKPHSDLIVFICLCVVTKCLHFLVDCKGRIQ